jgi:hypothetical protein
VLVVVEVLILVMDGCVGSELVGVVDVVVVLNELGDRLRRGWTDVDQTGGVTGPVGLEVVLVKTSMAALSVFLTCGIGVNKESCRSGSVLDSMGMLNLSNVALVVDRLPSCCCWWWCGCCV